MCGQCEWESMKGPVGQKRWFLCKAKPGVLELDLTRVVLFSEVSRKLWKYSRYFQDIAQVWLAAPVMRTGLK